MTHDDVYAGTILLLLSITGVTVGMPLLDEISPLSQGEVVTTGYLEEGWESIKGGEIATVTGIQTAGEEYVVEGQTYQDCVISYTIIPYSGVVSNDDVGSPLLLWNGQQVYASDIVDSVRDDGCEFHN